MTPEDYILGVRPYGLHLASLLCPWDSSGKNTGVGCHALLQGIFPTQGLNLNLMSTCIGRQVLYHWCHLGSPHKVWGGYFNSHKISFIIQYSMYLSLHLYITFLLLYHKFESNNFPYPETKESHGLNFHFLVSLPNCGVQYINLHFFFD